MSSRFAARLNYVELAADGMSGSKAFFEQVFGWQLTEFGPTYAATTTDDVDIGIDGSGSEGARPPLPIIEVDDLDAAEQAVREAGGVIVQPAYGFPGGRRFHFREPAGNELAVWQRAVPAD